MKFCYFLIVILVLGSCGKDDNHETGTGSFELRIDGEKTVWETNYAYQGPVKGLSILSHPVPVDFEKGNFEYLWFRFDHFEFNDITERKVYYPTTEISFYEGGKCESCFIATGTLEITRDGSTYNVIYELTGLDNQQIIGSYTGKISILDN